MTNAEVYIGDEDLIDQFIEEFNEFALTNDIDFKYLYLKETLVDFFKAERKPLTPKLTEDEKAILRNLERKYTYIARTYGLLWVQVGKDSASTECEGLFPLSHLFQSIKERRRI